MKMVLMIGLTEIKEGSAKMLSNNPIASLEDKSSVSDVILGQNPTDIITDVKENLNSDTKLYQETDQTETENAKMIIQRKEEWAKRSLPTLLEVIISFKLPFLYFFFLHVAKINLSLQRSCSDKSFCFRNVFIILNFSHFFIQSIKFAVNFL